MLARHQGLGPSETHHDALKYLSTYSLQYTTGGQWQEGGVVYDTGRDSSGGTSAHSLVTLASCSLKKYFLLKLDKTGHGNSSVD